MHPSLYSYIDLRTLWFLETSSTSNSAPHSHSWIAIRSIWTSEIEAGEAIEVLKQPLLTLYSGTATGLNPDAIQMASRIWPQRPSPSELTSKNQFKYVGVIRACGAVSLPADHGFVVSVAAVVHTRSCSDHGALNSNRHGVDIFPLFTNHHDTDNPFPTSGCHPVRHISNYNFKLYARQRRWLITNKTKLFLKTGNTNKSPNLCFSFVFSAISSVFNDSMADGIVCLRALDYKWMTKSRIRKVRQIRD